MDGEAKGEPGISEPGQASEEQMGGSGPTTHADPVLDRPAQEGPILNEPAVSAATVGETPAEVVQQQKTGEEGDATTAVMAETGDVAVEEAARKGDGSPPATTEATAEGDTVPDGRDGEQVDVEEEVGSGAAVLDPPDDGRQLQGQNMLPAPLPTTASMAVSAENMDRILLEGSAEPDPDFALGVANASDHGKEEEAPRVQQEEQDEFEYDIYVSHEHGRDNEKERVVSERVATMVDDLRGHNMPGTERPIRIYTASEGENFDDDEWMRAMCKSACVIVAVSQSYMDKVCVCACVRACVCM